MTHPIIPHPVGQLFGGAGGPAPAEVCAFADRPPARGRAGCEKVDEISAGRSEYGQDRQVIVPFTLVGHRGAMGLEPENTLRSFRRAVTEGADAIELDVRLSADGHLVILHDADVQRTTNGSGKVAEMSLREIKALDAGLGETIPTLEEVVDVIDLPMQIEIKAPEATPATLQLIRERRLRDHITVTSFSAEVVRATREQAPDVRTGLISSKARPETVEQARELGASVVCLGLGELSATIVERCHTEHLEIIGWPANTADDLVAALRLGIDGATSNYPALLRDVTRERPEVSELLR